MLMACNLVSVIAMLWQQLLNSPLQLIILGFQFANLLFIELDRCYVARIYI